MTFVDKGIGNIMPHDTYRAAKRHRAKVRKEHDLGFKKKIHKCRECGYYKCRCKLRKQLETERGRTQVEVVQ